jgi:hypothetical protein
MQNEQIYGLAINRSPVRLPKQKRIQAIKFEEYGVIFQDELKGCVMMDVHQKCL